MQLTPHFTLSEFTRSATARARHIDNTLDHSDLNDSRIINNLTALCIHVLEPLRKHINEPASLPALPSRESAANARTAVNDQANSELATTTPAISEPTISTPAPSLRGRAGGEAVPLIISSGYRCPRLNAAVGGVPNSQHLTGEAADIYLPSIAQGKEWFAWMMDNLEFDQLIFEHSSTRSCTSSPFPSRGRAGDGVHWIHVSYRSGSNRQQVIHNLRKK